MFTTQSRKCEDIKKLWGISERKFLICEVDFEVRIGFYFFNLFRFELILKSLFNCNFKCNFTQLKLHNYVSSFSYNFLPSHRYSPQKQRVLKSNELWASSKREQTKRVGKQLKTCEIQRAPTRHRAFPFEPTQSVWLQRPSSTTKCVTLWDLIDNSHLIMIN